MIDTYPKNPPQFTLLTQRKKQSCPRNVFEARHLLLSLLGSFFLFQIYSQDQTLKFFQAPASTRLSFSLSLSNLILFSLRPPQLEHFLLEPFFPKTRGTLCMERCHFNCMVLDIHISIYLI